METTYVLLWLSLNALAAYLTYRTVQRVNGAGNTDTDASQTASTRQGAHPSPPEMGTPSEGPPPADQHAPAAGDAATAPELDVERDDPLPADVESITCPNCGREQPMGYQFCELCIAPLPQ